MATIVATAIHFDSQKKLRKDRVWEMNKGILLDLAFSLSEVIKATKAEVRNLSRDPRDKEEEVDLTSFANVLEKINYALNVYRPLMSKELVKCCENFKNEDQKITKQVNSNEINDLEAYRELLGEYEKVYKEIQNFIFSMSGVKSV